MEDLEVGVGELRARVAWFLVRIERKVEREIEREKAANVIKLHGPTHVLASVGRLEEVTDDCKINIALRVLGLGSGWG
jgi:hypothetical protein